MPETKQTSSIPTPTTTTSISSQSASKSLVSNYAVTMDKLVATSWQVANLGTVVGLSSAVIALVQSPFNSVMMNLIKHQTVFAPGLHPRNGLLAAVYGLYAGLGPNLAGSTARTAYVTGAKKNSAALEFNEHTGAEEAGLEPLERKPVTKRQSMKGLGYVAAIALGDVIVTQYSDSKAQLIKAGVINSQFNTKTVHNAGQLYRVGFGARFGAGMVNFYALCMLEDTFARHLPFDEKTSHLFGGAASGMTAAIFSLPLSYWRDFVVHKTKVNNGKLQPLNSFFVAREIVEEVKKMGIGEALKKGVQEFKKQAPYRMGRTGVTFALLSWMGAALGHEPLAQVFERPEAANTSSNLFGFFSGFKASTINQPLSGLSADEKRPK